MRSILAVVMFAVACGAQNECANLAVSPSSDYAFLIGSAPAGGTYRWLLNGQTYKTGTTSQLFLLHADDSLIATEGKKPLDSPAVAYQPGRWGSALAIEKSGLLTYARGGNLDLNEGSIEMWVAPRAAGDDAAYTQRDHTLFHYRAPNGDRMVIAQSRTNGILYAGGTTAGQWQSAYGGQASMRGWKAGEWHHLAYTYSAAGNMMRFYVDGVLTADTNEKRYVPPSPAGDRFSLGGDLSAVPAHFLIDEIRISSRPMDGDEVHANARRFDQPRDNEVWLPLAGVPAGASLVFEATAAGGARTCASAAFLYNGVPLADADPPSTLLAPGTTSLAFSVRSLQPTSCGYSLGTAAEYLKMTPFDAGQGTTVHQTTFKGLSGDTTQVNKVYVRCASEPTYALELLYRSLPRVNPQFPRTGNLWGSSNLVPKGLEYASRIDLYLGASLTPAQIRALRALNPNILVLTSINTVENFGLPDDYYLKDIRGKKIEVWPGTFRLNLTKPYVAEHQARYAYQRIVDSGLMFDGCFFDNFFTTQSWLKNDIYGNRVQLDANEDGLEDNAAWLDAEWKKGVYNELEMWRKLMPNALASGHLPRPPQTEFSGIFNGDSIGFMTADVLEGKRPFQDLWDAYHQWWEIGRQPVITMVESSPQDQIAYGYDYEPQRKMPASTLEFARTWYPNVRFGLAFTLLNDGFFAHELGDTMHGQDWWYDELDFKLGYPLGPAQRVPVGTASTANGIENGGFEGAFGSTWRLTLNTSVGAAAVISRDTGEKAAGTASARVTIQSAGQGIDWHVDFNQPNRSLVRGKRYDLTFWAKAGEARTITLSSQKGSPDWRSYGLSRQVAIGTTWKQYTATFEANETASDARIQFFAGARTGDVWLDDVRLVEHPADVFRRDFTNGMALLNGTKQRQMITVGPGYNRIVGQQAPRYQYIVDDLAPDFSFTGNWREVTYDSDEWKAAGPFYHDWGPSCHQLDSGDGAAQWDLALREDDTYTIEAWWPAVAQASLPVAQGWTRRAVYEVVSGGKVVASKTLDQTTGGDEWHLIATLPLTVTGKPAVRLRSEGTGPVIADALHVRSARRYNDGSPAPTVTLEPLDGIILRKAPPAPAATTGGLVNAAGFVAGAPLAPGSIASVFGSNLAAAALSADSLPLPARLGETSVNFNGTLPAPLFYVSPQQANLQVPWELTGQKEASVSVTTGGGISAPVRVSLADAAPGLFSLAQSGNGQGVVLDSRYQLVDAGNPARPGDTVQIFATGLGPVSNRPASGVASPATPPAASLSTPTVHIGGVQTQVLFSGLTPGYVGLYQVNAQVPANAPAGNSVPVALTATGTSSNTVTLAVAQK
jgi:uncharacterized protein (TIGR03437 family)